MKESEDLSLRGCISVSPNPLPPGHSSCVIRWETVPPVDAEIAVSDNGAPEKLVARGRVGSSPIVWVQAGHVYQFHLYASDQLRRLASVSVRRSALAIDPLLAEVRSRLNAGEVGPREVAEFIASLIEPRLSDPEFTALFRLWEAHGFHVTPIGADQPIPDSQDLAAVNWEEPQDLAGFDLNPSSQRRFVREVFPIYRKELAEILTSEALTGDRSSRATGVLSGLDAAIAYCMLRHYSPKRVVEIGGSHSTVLLRKALRMNRHGTLLCLEPQPEKSVLNTTTGPDRLLRQRLAETDPAEFTSLEAGDILSVTTSHVVKLGSDVNYLFLKILPRLKTGVIVHLRDIFLPLQYPKESVLQERRFWSEHYILQAFLSGNADFEVLTSSGYLLATHLPDLQAAFPQCEKLEGSSFWIRRKRATGAKRVLLGPVPSSP